TWETSIYPTGTTYFGTPPDQDNNCQIEIMIYGIDGPWNTGGYFMPSIASTREIMYVDIDDLGWSETILAHEFQHLLHNARDPFEYLWIDEGNADMAVFLAFGASDTIVGHANGWATNASCSVRWWNQRTDCDYGAGFLFMLFLADNLGGGAAIQQLVADTRTGGNGIIHLAQTRGWSNTPIGETMSDIFANFTASVALDHSSQPEFGLDNIEMYEACGSQVFCRLTLSGSNLNWGGGVWQTTNLDMEGWGVHAFRFLDGTGSPLNLMVQPTELGFAGSILKRDAVSGVWSMERLRFDPVTGIGTGLVNSFGNATDDVYLIVWYESQVDDCDYNFANCNFPGTIAYPTAAIDIFAGLITEPASITINDAETTDRDNDTNPDTVEVTFDVNSTAFYEVLDVEVEVYVNNTVMDTMELSLEAGNGIPTETSIWFTPPWDGDWTLHFTMKNQIGEVVDQALTLPLTLSNMAPVAAGSAASNATQTWLGLQFYGAGYDVWGLGVTNDTLSHNVTPIGYAWDFDDGQLGSALKDPQRVWQTPGEYDVTLRVIDQGGYYSQVQHWRINVTDTFVPDPKIHVGTPPTLLPDPFEILTSQRILFSAAQTDDNVPLNNLHFEWDFGDGSAPVSGLGLYTISHEWDVGSAEGTSYTLTLTVNDGTHEANVTSTILVMNRVPRQIWFDDMETHTLTPLLMPNVFTDDDGTIVSTEWWFDEDVNLDGGIVNMPPSSTFDENHSFDANPTPAWSTPGWKNVTVYATDDAGNVSMATFQVEVLNQKPVALFARPDAGTTNTEYTFSSTSFDPDGTTSTFGLTYNWTITGLEFPITTVQVVHTFTEPGQYMVTLVVTDEHGEESHPKSYTVHIANPLPIPVMTVREAWLNDEPLQVPGSDDIEYDWRRGFTESGDIFVAPGTVLHFSSDGSRDADQAFNGMFNPDSSAPDWNGITETIWNWGDASPPTTTTNAWHIFEMPGLYTVTLTVRDSYGTGDTNVTTINVWVSSSPVITSENVNDIDFVTANEITVFEGAASDVDLDAGVVAWRDNNLSVDSDDDGISDNDRDIPLNSKLNYWWDLDDSVDSDGNGNMFDDWVTSDLRGGKGIDATWNESSTVTIRLKVCDDTNVCTTKAYDINVRSSSDDSDDGIGDLSISDFIPSADSGSLYILILVILVLTLGWLVMRQPDEVEVDAEEAASTYDVTEVHTEGGILGMDQHAPPPKPKHLTHDDRRSKDSGYVRPVTSRRRR
ncbi:MAG: PKD domain-containing protein, partial [Candidatus Thermoplasmatota archaeon]|nr:PKD domain-containing protein [Candidatus Thermoplasmatota archaeon]MEE3083575.1 PKD domain-containing protein [Candidatus Thermoplasmatota archaeon]